MGETDETVTLDAVLRLARQLSAIDKVRLIERVALEVKRELAHDAGGESLSLLGLLKDLGPAPTAEEIDSARREMWSSFG